MFHQVLRKATLAATLVLGMAGVAQAASIACSEGTPDVTGYVTPSLGCEILTSAQNDSDSTVSGMFLISDWKRIAKVESFGGTNGALTITGDELEGEWSISASIFDLYDDVMLIFKGANENSDVLPGTVIGYLLSSSSGDYDSPFFDIQGGNGPNAGKFKVKDISHISLYVANPSTIPLPAGLPLLALGLGALALVRRRKA